MLPWIRPIDGPRIIMGGQIPTEYTDRVGLKIRPIWVKFYLSYMLAIDRRQTQGGIEKVCKYNECEQFICSVR